MTNKKLVRKLKKLERKLAKASRRHDEITSLYCQTWALAKNRGAI